MDRENKTKILLVASSFEEISFITASKNKEAGLKTDNSSHYPLGLAYLHSALEAKGFIVETLFLNNHNFDSCFEKFVKTVIEFKPQIVSFQIITANRSSSFKLIDYTHNKYPDIKIVVGGVHATLMHRQILKKFPFLIAVLGEGELTFSELAARLVNEEPELANIKGIAFFCDGEVITGPPRELIENLDDLPFPKHEIFFNNNRKVGNLLTTRGCPFACSFCCLDTLSRRKVRKRSIRNVIGEIEWMIKKFPNLATIWIHDDSFFLDNDRVIEFCDEVISRRIKLNFACSGRYRPLKKEMVEKMEKANFKKVMFGLESGDESILKKSHKGITQKDAINAYKLFSRSKISIYSFLIVGLPGENKKSILETARLVKKLQKIKYTYYNEDIAILTVYPGTEIYQLAKEAGIINDDYWLTDKPTPLFTAENNQDELLRLKELLLAHISLDRIFTPVGIKNQFLMAPYIAGFLLKNNGLAKHVIHIGFKKIMATSKIKLFKPLYFFTRISGLIIGKAGSLLMKISGKINKTPQSKRVAIWKRDNGDRTMRVTYDLGENSLIFDVGGYEGQWAGDMYSRYNSNIHIFEPVKKYADRIEARFKKNYKIIINKFGLSSSSGKHAISLIDDSSSVHKESSNQEIAEFVDISEYLEKDNISRIDLIKINIEGGEYDLLERIIEKGLAKKIGNIQVQFHDFIPDAKNRMNNIQKKLMETHHLTYQYEFVWENWELNNK